MTSAAPQRRQEPQDKQRADQSNPLLGAGSACGFFGGGRQLAAEISVCWQNTFKSTEGSSSCRADAKKCHKQERMAWVHTGGCGGLDPGAPGKAL